MNNIKQTTERWNEIFRLQDIRFQTIEVNSLGETVRVITEEGRKH